MVKKVGDYNLEQKIGEGAYGTVFKGCERNTGVAVAVKSVDRTSLNGRLLKQMELEIKTMKRVQSDYIVKLHDVLMTTNNVYLVMEFCEGGDLEQVIQQYGPVQEHIAKRWIGQLLSAFVTLQESQIIHRDLKLANILLSSHDLETANLKLADFGFARILNENSLAQTQLGTPLFMAPELLKKEAYSFKVDVWSLGALSYEIMTGKTLYACQTLTELKKLQSQPIAFPEDCQISDCGKDFVMSMLTYDSAARPSFETLQNHPFLRPVMDSLIASTFLAPSEEPSIREADEEVERVESPVVLMEEEPSLDPSAGPSIGSSLPRQGFLLLDIALQVEGSERFRETAKVYEANHELMIAYAYYSRYIQIKATQLERLELYVAESHIDLEENLNLIDMMSDLKQSIAEVSQIVAELQTQMPRKVMLDQSWEAFEPEPDFKLDVEVLLHEVERVLGTIPEGDEALKAHYMQADELLQMAIKASPDNLQASALSNEVREKYRLLLG